MADTIVAKKQWTFKTHSTFIQNTTPELRKRGKKLRQGLSFEAICLFTYLSSFASKSSPQPYPSMATIRFDTGWGISTIKKYRRELERFGLLEREQHKEEGKWSSNLYTLGDTALPSTNFASVENQPAENEPAQFQPTITEPTKRYQCTGRGTSAGTEDRHEVPEPGGSGSTGPSGGAAAAAEASPSAPTGAAAPGTPARNAAAAVHKKAEEFIQQYRYWAEQAGWTPSVVPRERQAVLDFFQDNPKFTVRELTSIMVTAWIMPEKVNPDTKVELFWFCRFKSRWIKSFLEFLPNIQDEIEWTGTEKRIEKSMRIAQENFRLRKAA